MPEEVKPHRLYCAVCGLGRIHFEVNNGLGVGEALGDDELAHLDLSGGVCLDCGTKGQVAVNSIKLTGEIDF